MRTSIATVCLSGSLTEKLHAAAGAGFDGVELFEPDLVASPASPQEVVALADKLGLTLDLYQPVRDAEREPELLEEDVDLTGVLGADLDEVEPFGLRDPGQRCRRVGQADPR